MQYTYKFTQNDFPFPYNKSDIWKDGFSIGWAITIDSGVYSVNRLSIDFDKMAYEKAKQYILKSDNGAILNALETTKHNLSQDEVDDIFAQHKLTKDEYKKKIKESFNKNV